VFDLAEVISKKWRPEDKLLLWKHVPNLKVLVCGGDGTMGWMFSCIDRYKLHVVRHVAASAFTLSIVHVMLSAQQLAAEYQQYHQYLYFLSEQHWSLVHGALKPSDNSACKQHMHCLC
jgi:hypothetical protein